MDRLGPPKLPPPGGGVAVGRDGYFIIDGDSHVLEPPDLWDEYLEPEFRPRAIRIARSIAGRDGEARGYPHIDSSADALDQIFESTARLSDERRRLILGENARRLYRL